MGEFDEPFSGTDAPAHFSPKVPTDFDKTCTHDDAAPPMGEAASEASTYLLLT